MMNATASSSSTLASTGRRRSSKHHEASSDAAEWARKKKEAAEKAKVIREERKRAQLLREMQAKLDEDAAQQTQALAEGVSLELVEETVNVPTKSYTPAHAPFQREGTPEIDFREDIHQDEADEDQRAVQQAARLSRKPQKQRPEWNNDFAEVEPQRESGPSHAAMQERPAFGRNRVS